MAGCDTNDQCVSDSVVIEASPETIFDILASPAGHAEIDGSGSVQRAKGDVDRLALGTRFGMNMRFGVPYSISNTVVEFEENRLIAWQHLGRHRWRYELEPISDTETRVTESFDWSTALVPKAIEMVGYPEKNLESIKATLQRLTKAATKTP